MAVRDFLVMTQKAQEGGAGDADSFPAGALSTAGAPLPSTLSPLVYQQSG
jgi:hypothetical protein